MDARNPFQADTLEMALPPDLALRQTPAGQPTVQELCPPGSIVRTNYNTGPYVVRRLAAHTWRGCVSWSLHCSKVNSEKIGYWLNDYVAVDGRLVHLFSNNDDRVIVTRRPRDARPAGLATLRAAKGKACCL